MRKTVLFLSALVFAQITGVVRADWQVWTTPETRHVLRSEAPGATREVNLSAARNEWVSFQILTRSDQRVKGIRVEAADLTGPDAKVLTKTQARLYRQHQLFLDTGTYRNAAFKPDWYPDPLIPFEYPPGATAVVEKRLSMRAIPFDLPANETHGFWIDLYVPTNTATGEYRGTYRVSSDAGKTIEVPVALKVWNFELPAVGAFETEFGSPAGQLRNWYAQKAKNGKGTMPADWPAVETQCSQLLADHRINAVPPRELLRPVAQADGTYRIPPDKLRALGEFVERYHVNALQIPHPSNAVKDPEAEREKLHAWLSAFDKAAKELNRPHLVFYTYLKDEPNTLEDYRYVQKWGKAVRDAKSVVKVLVVEQTWTAPKMGGADSAWGDLYGCVDIWCPLFSLHKQESAAQRQALGETIWAYTALCQGEPTPWWHIDFPLLNYRVPSWIAWRDRMRGLLYWGGMSYWKQVEDPWLEAPFYRGNGNLQQGKKGILFHGEGSLVYPAHAVGYEGIVPTIRLKALRDGIEDYEYLALLERLGKADEGEKIVSPVAESFFKWDKNPSAYEAARAKLAALIEVSAQR